MENYKERLPRYLRQDAEKQRAELLETVGEYKKCLEILEGIKRTHKKDGSDFQNVVKNFEMPDGSRLEWYYIITSKYMEVRAYPHKIMLEYHDIADQPTADEIRGEIQLHIEKYKKRIKEAENNAEKFGGELDQLASITATLGEFLDKLESGNDYKLRDLLKHVL